jgi:hypothetical protein
MWDMIGLEFSNARGILKLLQGSLCLVNCTPPPVPDGRYLALTERSRKPPPAQIFSVMITLAMTRILHQKFGKES